MVVGIDALIGVLHKEIERDRDSKQAGKNKRREALLSIETCLDSTSIKIRLCKDDGYYLKGKLKEYIPEIVLEIHETAKETRDIFQRKIYDGLMDLVNRFVSFNEKISESGLYNLEQFSERLLEEVNKLKEVLKSVGSEK